MHPLADCIINKSSLLLNAGSQFFKIYRFCEAINYVHRCDSKVTYIYKEKHDHVQWIHLSWGTACISEQSPVIIKYRIAHMKPRPFCIHRDVWAVKIFILNWSYVPLGSVFTESRLDRCKHKPFASNPAMKYWRSNPIMRYLSIVYNGSHDEDRKYRRWL